MLKIGVHSTYYGGQIDPRHAACVRELRQAGIGVAELHGSPYPEMARAEAVRQALESELDVLVFLDSNVTAPVDCVRALARDAARAKGVAYTIPSRKISERAWTPGTDNALSFCAIHRSVFDRLAGDDDRTYANSAVLGTGLSRGARPFFSPWQKDGTWLATGVYPSEDISFLMRVRRAGIRCVEADHPHDIVSRPVFSLTVQAGKPEHRYAVCVPSFGGFMFDQHRALEQLADYGMPIIRAHNCPYIDIARSLLVTKALDFGLDGVFFVDHDIVFRPEDVPNLIAQAEERQAIVAAAYCMRRSAHAVIGAVDCEPGTMLRFFDGGKLYPALYTGLGFAAIPRSIFDGLSTLPKVEVYGIETRPYFSLDISGTFYCGEDVSFCNRVQALHVAQIGVEDWDVRRTTGGESKIFIDSRIRIFHQGSYDYGLEDAGIVVPRVSSLSFQAFETREEARTMHRRADELGGSVQQRSLEAAGLYKEPEHGPA